MGVDYQINEVTSLTNQLLLRYLGDEVVNATKDDHHDDCTAPDGDLVSQTWNIKLKIQSHKTECCREEAVVEG